MKGRHHEWPGLKAKTRYDLVCSLLFQRGASISTFQLQASALPQTLNSYSSITPFRAANFSGTKHQTQKASGWIFRRGDTGKCVTFQENKGLFFFFAKMRMFNSAYSSRGISNIHRSNCRCQVAEEYDGYEEACSLKASEPASGRKN